MSRVKITEYRAKRLVLGDAYHGVSFSSAGKKPSLPKGPLVLKVDQGVKKRFKQGLVAVGVKASEAPSITAKWEKKGYTNFITEPLIPHEPGEERYLSLERIREGIRLLYAKDGGIDIEAHPDAVQAYVIAVPADMQKVARKTGLPHSFLRNLIESFERDYFAFLEINPLIIRGEDAYLLDAAALMDSAGIFFVSGRWGEEDIVSNRTKYRQEETVRELQKTTPASVKLTVLHPEGKLFFLLSGGGGSIVIADEAALKGAGGLIGNYGEYSGGPTREETHLYAREILDLALRSPEKQKALIVAGGVANFTDVKATFAGIIDALMERTNELKKAGVKVFVRRGGPNEAAGLAHMEAFLAETGLLGSVHGSDAPLTIAVDEALEYLKR